MAWKKLLLAADAVTELTGTAHRSLITDAAGDVVEVAHGALNKVWTAQGASADPSWEDAQGGPHGLDAGQTDVVLTSPADNEVLAYDSGSTNWINQTPAEAGLETDTHAASHQNGGADELSVAGLSGLLADDQNPTSHALGTAHSADTLANLNAKVSDATLDDSSDPRTPTAHEASHKSGGSDEILLHEFGAPTADVDFNQQKLDGAILEYGTTTMPDSGTEVEGQLCYKKTDDHVYVWVA